jgi:hypothetical protein
MPPLRSKLCPDQLRCPGRHAESLGTRQTAEEAYSLVAAAQAKPQTLAA